MRENGGLRETNSRHPACKAGALSGRSFGSIEAERLRSCAQQKRPGRTSRKMRSSTQTLENPVYQPLAKGPVKVQRFRVVSSRGQNGFVRLQEGGAALGGPAFSVPSRVPKHPKLRWTRLDRCRRNGAGQGQKRLIKQTDQHADGLWATVACGAGPFTLAFRSIFPRKRAGLSQ